MLPLLCRVVAHLPGGIRAAERRGAGPLRARRGCPARREHHAVRHALPLGSPPGDAGPRRLDEPGTRSPLPAEYADRLATSATASPTGSRTMSPGSSPGSATSAASTRRVSAVGGRACKWRITSSSRTARRYRSSAPTAAPTHRSASRSISPLANRRRIARRISPLPAATMAS